MAALFDQPDALRAAVLAHIADIGAVFKGQCADWDVVNEPFSNFDVQCSFFRRRSLAAEAEIGFADFSFGDTEDEAIFAHSTVMVQCGKSVIRIGVLKMNGSNRVAQRRKE